MGISEYDTDNNSLMDDFGDSFAGFGDESDVKKSYKLYNFKRPDKFSKDHLRALKI